MASLTFQRPSLALSLLAFLALCVLISLGTWQVYRLQWKTALIERREAQIAAAPAPFTFQPGDDPATFDFRRVALAAEPVSDAMLFAGIAKIDGQVGHQAVQAVRLDDGRNVLVDRGLVPEAAMDKSAQLSPLPDEMAIFEGVLRDRSFGQAGWFTPPPDLERGVFYAYDLPAMAQALGLDSVLPLVLELDASFSGEPYPVAGLTRVDLPNSHLQYAITWYGLAAGLIGVFVAMTLKRRSEA